MATRQRTQASITGARETMAIAATLGGVIRSARRARRWSLATLAARVRISPARLSEIERGLGGRAPLETWIALGIAIGRPLAVTASKPFPDDRPADAGHLDIQEHLLGLGRATGRAGTFEVPTRPSDPLRSTDVGLRDPERRVRILAECWNTFGDIGAAVRATHRKEQEATATWPEDRIAIVWIVRSSEANRRLLARFPHILDAAFPGSSRAWVRALEAGRDPPDRPGLVWFDPATRRLRERRATRTSARTSAP
jgi:transcriptional regulator with XRE-family HTH domain